MPGLFSCAAGIGVPPKTIVASRAGVYALPQNACWVLDPKLQKSTANGGLFHRPYRSGCASCGRCEHTSFQPVKSPVYQRPQGRIAAPPVERLARQQSGPCRGIGGGPNKQILQVFAGAKRWKIVSCVPRNTACHYLRTAKGEVRLMPIRCT